MLQQYGQQPAGYGLGGAAGLDFGGGTPGGADLRAASTGSAFGGNPGMSQGFQQVHDTNHRMCMDVAPAS